jgi:dTDP-4-amino-4,6-dideoxygalactose transaminase
VSPTVEPVPFVDLQAAHQEVAGEIRAGMERVLGSSAFIKGADVAEFEREFAAFCGTAHCIGVANGTDAIELALRAAEIPAGAEVVMPANTFVATAAAVIRAGASPVFADVDPDCLLMDPVMTDKAIGPDTAALVPVHLFGQLAPMPALADVATAHGLTLIEDAAQCQGASQDGLAAGAFSAAAATSFYPGKNLGAYGDAGAVLTGSAELARQVRLLADHGSDRKYVHERLGFNSRMDSFQAVVLRAKLRRLESWNQLRREAAQRYGELLAGIDGVSLPHTASGNQHVWHLYVVQVPDRDRVLELLQASGIQAGVHYPVPVHLQPAFRARGHAAGDFPVAEAAAGRILSLPMYPQITMSQQQRVADALAAAIRAL